MRLPKWRKVDHGQLPISGVWGEEQESVKETSTWWDRKTQECVESVTECWHSRDQWCGQLCVTLVMVQNLQVKHKQSCKTSKIRITLIYESIEYCLQNWSLETTCYEIDFCCSFFLSWAHQSVVTTCCIFLPVYQCFSENHDVTCASLHRNGSLIYWVLLYFSLNFP